MESLAIQEVASHLANKNNKKNEKERSGSNSESHACFGSAISTKESDHRVCAVCDKHFRTPQKVGGMKLDQHHSNRSKRPRQDNPGAKQMEKDDSDDGDASQDSIGEGNIGQRDGSVKGLYMKNLRIFFSAIKSAKFNVMNR